MLFRDRVKGIRMGWVALDGLDRLIAPIRDRVVS